MLIQNLNNNKSKLLDDVKSSSVARFNDTPQNSGDFSDDNHTSNITTTTSSSNVGTMMQRLNEIVVIQPVSDAGLQISQNVMNAIITIIFTILNVFRLVVSLLSIVLLMNQIRILNWSLILLLKEEQQHFGLNHLDLLILIPI